MTRSQVLVVTCIFILGATPVGAEQTWSETTAEWAKKAADAASWVRKQLDIESPLTVALDKTYKQLKEMTTITDKTLVDDREFERVVTETQALKAIEIEIPESLNSKSAYERITEGVRDPGTLAAGDEELEKLQDAADAREKQVSDMKGARDRANELADRYQNTANVAENISRRTEHLVGNVWIEIVSRFTRGSFSLTWLDFSESVLPALRERAEAAKNLVKRYDKAIKGAEKDLTVFNGHKALLRQIWDGSASATALNAPSDQLSTIAIIEIATAVKDQNQATMAAARALREEAEKIRGENSKISNFQKFLGLVKTSLEAKNAATNVASGSNDVETGPDVDTSKPNSRQIDSKDKNLPSTPSQTTPQYSPDLRLH